MLIFKQLPDDFVFNKKKVLVKKKNVRAKRAEKKSFNNDWHFSKISKERIRNIPDFVQEMYIRLANNEYFVGIEIPVSGFSRDYLEYYEKMAEDEHKSGCNYCMNGENCPILSRY